jgi:hypothetical protein
MTLQIILGALLSVVGVLSAGMGLIFLIGSHGISSRLIAGGIMVAGGLALLVTGIIVFRRGSRFSPAGIRKQLLRLARMNNGELTEEAITGSLGSSDAVGFQVASLLKEGVAVEMRRDNRRFYLFEDFKLKMVLKKCPYCGNDYPVRDDIEKCPACGGDLKVTRSMLAKGGEKYSMDEEDDSGVS